MNIRQTYAVVGSEGEIVCYLQYEPYWVDGVRWARSYYIEKEEYEATPEGQDMLRQRAVNMKRL